MMLNEAINTYNNLKSIDSDYFKAHQACIIAKGIEKAKAGMTTYFGVLEKGEFEEVLSLDFWDSIKSSKWLKGMRLEADLRSLEQTPLACFGIAEETDGHCTRTGGDLLHWIERAIGELRALMKKIKKLTMGLPVETFAKLYEKQSAKIDFEPVADSISEWKFRVGRVSFKKIKAYQTEVVALFLNKELLKHHYTINQIELDEVDMEKVKKQLRPDFKFSEHFKEMAAIFRRFIKWNGHILIIDIELYGKYVIENMAKFCHDELMEFFAFEKKIMLINQEMMNLPPEERKKVFPEEKGIDSDAQNQADSTSAVFEPVELKFFDSRRYNSDEKQLLLRKLMIDTATKIDVNNGRDWFCLYAAERYSQGCLGSKQGYVDFFSDIEKLAPEVLKKINQVETGYKRYKDYAELLSREVENWFVFNKCLPPINELLYQPKFGCDRDVFMRYSQVIKDLSKQMKDI